MVCQSCCIRIDFTIMSHNIPGQWMLFRSIRLFALFLVKMFIYILYIYIHNNLKVHGIYFIHMIDKDNTNVDVFNLKFAPGLCILTNSKHLVVRTICSVYIYPLLLPYICKSKVQTGFLLGGINISMFLNQKVIQFTNVNISTMAFLFFTLYHQ